MKVCKIALFWKQKLLKQFVAIIRAAVGNIYVVYLVDCSLFTKVFLKSNTRI